MGYGSFIGFLGLGEGIGGGAGGEELIVGVWAGGCFGFLWGSGTGAGAVW